MSHQVHCLAHAFQSNLRLLCMLLFYILSGCMCCYFIFYISSTNETEMFAFAKSFDSDQLI